MEAIAPFFASLYHKIAGRARGVGAIHESPVRIGWREKLDWAQGLGLGAATQSRVFDFGFATRLGQSRL